MLTNDDITERLDKLKDRVSRFPYVPTDKYILYYEGKENTDMLHPVLAKMMVVGVPFNSYNDKVISNDRPLAMGVMALVRYSSDLVDKIHTIVVSETETDTLNGYYYVYAYEDILAAEADFRYFANMNFDSDVNYLELYGTINN